MASMSAQQLARQRLAATDVAKFAPPPPKRKKAEPEPPKYTKQTVKMSAEERMAKQKAYAHAYYLAHKDEKKKRNAEYRQKNPELYRSNSLQWYYDQNFEYRLGQEIEIKDFNLMYNVECASGFHFFRTRKEAEEYNV